MLPLHIGQSSHGYLNAFLLSNGFFGTTGTIRSPETNLHKNQRLLILYNQINFALVCAKITLYQF